MECKKCGKEFERSDKGCKLVSKPHTPYPLCPECTRLDKDIYCNNCKKTFKVKDGYLDECWKCQKQVCKFCSTNITIKGIFFSFCGEHKNYDKKQLREDTQNIIEEEKEVSSH